MAKVQYIGCKAQATDRHAHSGKVWAGNGDVQEVTDAQAAILCKFTDSFALVPDVVDEAAKAAAAKLAQEKAQADESAAAEQAVAEETEKDKLEAEARTYGAELDKRKSLKTLRKQVEALRAVGAQ